MTIRLPEIVVSAGFLRPGIVGGAEQALYGTIDALASAVPPSSIRVIGRAALATRSLPPGTVVETRPGLFENRFLWETLDLPRFARGVKNILFTNYFTPPTFPGRRKTTIIYDLQYLHFPRNFSGKKRRWLRACHRATLALADAVIVPSTFVRDDIIRAYGGDASKIVTLPAPVRWESFDRSPSGGAVAPRTILSVSAHWPHKNLRTLVRAFALVAPRAPDVRLVLVGQPFDRLIGMVDPEPPVSELATALGVADRVTFTGYVSEDRVAELYRDATVFVFPSIFEGLGLPPVEALGLGLPVLTTDRTAIPETTMGFAHYVTDPFDAGEMADRLSAMLDDPKAFAPTADQIAAIRHRYAASTLGPMIARTVLGTEP